MIRSQVSASDFFKPKLGFFSYLSSNSPPDPKTKKKKSFRVSKPFKFALSNSHNSSAYNIPEYKYIESKHSSSPASHSSSKLLKSVKVFKPAGPLNQSFAYPYMPSTLKDQEPPKPSKKNILVPARNGIFSHPEYIPQPPEAKPHKIVKRKKINSKKPFSSMTNPKSVFSYYPHNLRTEEKSEENFEKTETEEKTFENLEKSEKSENFEKIDEKKNSQDHLIVFKAGSRNTSDLFGRFRYESDIKFPPKKKEPSLPSIHQKPFRPTGDMQTGASSSIMNSSWILKKEYKLF